MALSRASKTEKVGKLAAELEHSTSAIIGTFKGLTASKDFELRKTVRAAGGRGWSDDRGLSRSAESRGMVRILKGYELRANESVRAAI